MPSVFLVKSRICNPVIPAKAGIHTHWTIFTYKVPMHPWGGQCLSKIVSTQHNMFDVISLGIMTTDLIYILQRCGGFADGRRL